jgi:ferredoxin
MLYAAHTSVFFSPTGTSRRVLEAIGRGLKSSGAESFDLTCGLPESPPALPPDMLALIGVPVYAGRVAPPALTRLEKIRGNNTPAVLVVLYGNRAYEDALLELRDWAVEAGFLPVACAAFIGEHSFATDQYPIAAGRPDQTDLEAAEEFGRAVQRKMEGVRTAQDIAPLEVPGKLPYREIVPGPAMAPEVLENCIVCGECAAVCPTQAIQVGEETVVDATKCIRCCACVRACPEQALRLNAPKIMQIREFLCKEHGERKEPEMFL